MKKHLKINKVNEMIAIDIFLKKQTEHLNSSRDDSTSRTIVLYKEREQETFPISNAKNITFIKKNILSK